MTKMWIALVVTNAIWAGWAVAQTVQIGPPGPNDLPISGPSIMVAGETPSHQPITIKTDEDGYVICSPERKPQPPSGCIADAPGPNGGLVFVPCTHF